MILVVFYECEEAPCFSLIEDTSENNKLLRGYHHNFIGQVNEPEGLHDFFYNEDGSYKHQRFNGPLENGTYSLIIITGMLP